MALSDTVKFLPPYLQTVANRRFLGSTLDLLVNQPSITRFNGYIGRDVFNGEVLPGNYLLETTPVRTAYQLEAAFITRDSNQNIVEVSNFLDLLNASANKDAVTNSWNRLLTNNLYSWKGFNNLDKIINYQNYCWIATSGNDWYWKNSILVQPTNTVQADIIGQVSYTDPTGITLLDGMIVSFPTSQPAPYNTGAAYIVEGIGQEIVLVPVTNILTPAFVLDQNNPPDYLTIERDAADLNLWSRTNLWVHKDTVDSIIQIQSARIPGFDVPTKFTLGNRPIIEFESLILFNSGKIGLPAATYFDNSTTDAFYMVQGQTNFAVDGFQLNTGDSVIFNADHNPDIRENVYDVNFVDTTRTTQIPRLYPVQAVSTTNITLFGLQTIDGYVTLQGDRILVLGQVDQSQNGIYLASNIGWTRFSDFAGSEQVGVLILYGTMFKNTYYIYTPANIINNATVGTLTPTGNAQIYTMSFTPDPNSLLVWDNFPLIPEVGYTVSGDTVTFTSAPGISDTLTYQGWTMGTAPITTPISGPLIGIQDGTNRVFTVPAPPDDSTLIIWDNFPLVEGDPDGYTLEGLTVTFVNAPSPTDSLFYQAWSKWTVSTTPVIQLVLRDTAQFDNTVLITSGQNYADKMVVWDGTFWDVASENKSAINQAPLFDVFDLSGNSFGNVAAYPDTSFNGSELFSYEIGAGPNDTVLGFPLTYGPVGNLNDVIFDNNYVTDTFSYTGVTTPQFILDGRAHLIDPLSDIEAIFDAWQYVPCDLELYQNLLVTGLSTITFAGNLLVKSTPNTQQTQVFVDGTQLAPSGYTVTQVNGNITVTLTTTVDSTSEVFIKILSTTPIPGAYYDVPPAFDHNPLGTMLATFNMGELRLHAQVEQNNANDTSGIVDLFRQEYAGVPGSILFQEAISMLPTLMLCNKTFDIDQSIRAAGEDYNLFKQRFLNISTQIPNVNNLTVKQAVDQVLQKIAASFISVQPWATSDMCYWGGAPQTISVTNPHLTIFNLVQTYDFTQPNTKELQVYLNNNQLIIGRDYTVDGNVLTVLAPLNFGDALVIYEIANTTGSYIPATPTKLGLAQAYVPQIYMDYTYQTPRLVLQGHDGSITTCYGDYRDTFLLDYELRVFNNLKVDNQLLFDTIQSHVPNGGRWRSEQAATNALIAPYTPSELLTIQQRMFYEWAAEYNVSYVNSFYDAEDMFTWNWSSSLDKLSDHQPLLGYWRGIYRWFYDTEYVNTKPWEALGLSIKPTWWDATYGVAPYTGANTVLWEDIAQGIIRDPAGLRFSTYGPKTFGPNSVLEVIPVDASGNLLDPNDSVVGILNTSASQNDFVFGDGAPAEEAWRRSSIYPFAQLRTQILQNPLFMCGVLWDTNNYLPTVGLNEFRFEGNYLGSISQVTLNSVDNNGAALVNSILNYSIEYMRRNGQDPTLLRTSISNTVVQLMYPLGGFSSANDLVAFGSPNNPTDVGAAELIPVQDYTLFLNESTPTGTLNYSGVVVNVTEAGSYQISGYNKVNPFFTIYPANAVGPYVQIGVAPNFYRYPTAFGTTPQIVPYNTIFTSVQSLINFLAGYENFLTGNGITFTTNTSQTQVDWQAAAIQFIKWSLTNWGTSIPLSLVLNPSSSIVQYDAASGTLADLTNPLSSLVLDVNGSIITQQFLDVYRDVNSVTITHQGGGIFACIAADIVSFEHRVVFDNVTAFDDTIYDPVSGVRQNRLTLSGQKSANWNGTLDSPGFLICSKLVQPWNPNQDYLFGTLVQFKNNNYVATQNVIGAATFQYGQFQLISTIFTNSILPNLSLKAQDYLQSYNVNYRPFLTDLVNLRNNTIGYIERDWLAILDIDLGAQTAFYKGWIKEKGTLNSLNSYGRGSTPQLNTVVGINEEYAMKVGVYGSDLRTGYGDVSLPPTINTQNPLVISFVASPNVNDSNSIQVTPNRLYEKSANWTNDFVQYYGNLQLGTSSFVSGGPVIPQELIAAAQASIPGFIKTDEPSLFFPTVPDMVLGTQESVLKIAENGGSFWIENNQLAPGPNQWDVLTFSPASTAISSITRINSNAISFILSSDIGAKANSAIVIDYTDVGSNVSIRGTFLVNDYFIAPFRTANTSGYANLIITTASGQFGNVFINYQNPVPTSDIYVSRSLRANSIAEAPIVPADSTQYVINDSTGEAAYNLTIPYQTEITYGDVSGGVAVNSMAYDSPNQVIWCGKPSAVPSGVVELRVVGAEQEPNGLALPTINTEVFVIQPKNPSSTNLGNIVVAANNFAAVTADTPSLPGQIYICVNNPRHAPSVLQILNANTSSPYVITDMALSSDAHWLYAVQQPSGNVAEIAVFSLESNPNIGQPWFPVFPIVSTSPNASITVGDVIHDAFSITVAITDNTDLSSRVLIPNYEYTVSGFVITVNVAAAGTTYIGDVNHTTTVTGLSEYYKYQGTIVPASYGISNLVSGFGASIACDALGTTLAVGAPSNGGNVVVFSRITENQYLQASTSTVTPVNPFSTITSVKVNGLSVAPSLSFSPSLPAGTLVQIEGFCFNIEQIIAAPNPTDLGFGTSVAIQNNQLVVGSVNTPVGSQYSKGAAYLYALDTSITSAKIIPIADLSLSTEPFLINSWVITPSDNTLSGLVAAINAGSGYTGVSASVQSTNLILSINPALHTSGVGSLGL
jgi:hypothetical protein